MNREFRLVVLDGMEEREIQGDSVRVYFNEHEYVELSPRKSDGEITLYAVTQLVIRPIASNCARVDSKR